MPVTIKSTQLMYKNGSGEYVDVDVVSEQTTAEKIAAIEAKGAEKIAAVESKGAETIASIPSDYTELSDEVNDLKADLSELEKVTERVDTKIDSEVTSGVSWASGRISNANGSSIVDNSFIRTEFFITIDKIDKFYLSDAYIAMVYAWNSTDGTFIGNYKQNGTFGTGAGGIGVNNFDFTRFPEYKFKVIVRKEPVSTDITPEDGSQVKFYKDGYTNIVASIDRLSGGITEGYDLLSNATYESGKAIEVLTGIGRNESSCSITSYIPVSPGAKIIINNNKAFTYRYGVGFYDENLAHVNGKVYGSKEEISTIVPKDAYFARFTINTENIQLFGAKIFFIGDVDNSISKNPYARIDIKEYGTLYKGYPHVGFPRMCYFNGRIISVFRCGERHLPHYGDTSYGVLQMIGITLGGEVNEIKTFSSADFQGVVGDARDFYIQPSRDGQYLFMVGGFTHYETSDTFYYDIVLACFNKNLEIVDYKAFLNNEYYPYGNPLMTPNGHIIFTAFHKGLHNTIIYRSNEIFSSGVNSLSFEIIPVFENTTLNCSECCMGYYNDKLIFLQRYEGTNQAKMKITDNLEGVDGWGNAIDLGLSIHSPMLLPYYSGRYLLFVGSRRKSAEEDRDGIIGFIDCDNNSVVAYENLDDKLMTAFNGYPTIVQIDDYNFAVMYYQESPAKTTANAHSAFTGLYYKWINVRELFSQMAYNDLIKQRN